MYHDDDLLTDKAASPVVGWSPSTLRKRRVKGGGPPFLKVGGLVRYRYGTLQQWLAEREVRNTAEADQLQNQSTRRQA